MSNVPNISTPTWDASNPSGLIFMVDLDWPLENERVSRLHWLATGLTLSSTTPPPDGNTTALLTIPDPHAITYMPPAPPIGDVAHTYAFYLFSVPPSFAVPPQYQDLDAGDTVDENGTLTGAETRVPFNVNQFLLDCGLAEDDVLARNHVRVRNLAGHPTTTFPPPRQTTGTIEDEVPEPSSTAGSGQGAVSTGGVRGRGEGVGMGLWVWSAMAVLSGVLCFVV